jgi:hypothetical protein
MVGISGIGNEELLKQAAQEAQGLGLFIRGLVGLDMGAAKEAFADFLAARRLQSNQIEFVNMIIESLAERGVVEAARLYESPFTDLAPSGPEGAVQRSGGDRTGGHPPACPEVGGGGVTPPVLVGSRRERENMVVTTLLPRAPRSGL